MVSPLDAEEGLQVMIVLLGLFQITSMPCVLDYYQLSAFPKMPNISELIDLERVTKTKHNGFILKTHLFSLWPISNGNTLSPSPKLSKLAASNQGCFAHDLVEKKKLEEMKWNECMWEDETSWWILGMSDSFLSFEIALINSVLSSTYSLHIACQRAIVTNWTWSFQNLYSLGWR